MRTVVDDRGQGWDVLVGKASWGTLVLLFVPRDGGEARSVVVAEETPFEAEQALDRLDDDALRARLRDTNAGTGG